MIEFSDEEKLRVKKEVIEKLNKSFEVNSAGDGVPFYKAILHLLDIFNLGNFYGCITIKLMGPKLKSITHDSVSIRLDTDYEMNS